MRLHATTGAQAIMRTLELLKLVSERTTKGHLLPDLVTRSGFTRPTVYRLLAALEEAGLVDQDPATRRWHLGEETYVLGSLAAERFSIERLAQESLLKIARETEESAFLSIRRSNEVVCLQRIEGTYPIRTHVLQAGDRLPLGVGSAGLAILAALPMSEIQSVIDGNREELRRRYPQYSVTALQELVAVARDAGFAVNRGLLFTGSWGIAAAVRDASGSPIAALSVTAVELRLQPSRQVIIGRLLVDEATSLSAVLKSRTKVQPKRRAA